MMRVDATTTESDESRAQRGDTCAAPSCWREGRLVRVVGETVRKAVLCETHRKALLGVSS
ncbi:hypothetical protein ACOJIV_20650 [Haloarcula sp. AONF1]